MDRNLIARASITIDAASADVWDALVHPTAIKQYMFGTDVDTDWREGSAIVWRGEWQGKLYEDRGVILAVTPERTLQYTHFSPLSGLPDTPDNHRTITIELSNEGGRTQISLSQDNNRTEEERDHSEKNWVMVLTGLKNYLEK